MKGGPEGDGESPSGWWGTRTGVELAIFGSKSSQNTSERVDIEVSKCGGEARHEVELGTHKDASIRVEIDASGIWGHKDIALQCVGPALQEMGSGRHRDVLNCIGSEVEEVWVPPGDAIHGVFTTSWCGGLEEVDSQRFVVRGDVGDAIRVAFGTSRCGAGFWGVRALVKWL